ncbi:Nitrate reductase [NADH] (Fragment) [Seminavis robusta]|uniref:Nitrate reductase [NADH] n=1 Tax=Seminavis robusta TaxID=568900 RepID=A0A9N8DI23_9STRA
MGIVVHPPPSDYHSDAPMPSSGVHVVSSRSVGSVESDICSDSSCTACRLCDDVCGNSGCLCCEKKSAMKKCKELMCDCKNGEARYTMCQIRRHATEESAWLVAGGYVYDVTDYIACHPGGKNSILKKCGGVADCMQDLQFHSNKGKKLWRKYRIGRVLNCGEQEDKLWWMFWK